MDKRLLPVRARWMAAPLLAVILAGCARGPDYRAPDTPPAAAGPFVSQSAYTRTAPPPDDWWRLYDDAALNALVARAFDANADLLQAQANLARARAIYDEARSSLWPATLAHGGAQYGRDQAAWAGGGQAPAQWSYSGGLQIAYEVDLYGRVRRDIEAARYDAESMAAARDAVRVAVAAETTRAYTDACTLGDAIDIARASAGLAADNLRLVSSRLQAGAATQLDVERAGAAAARAQAAVAPLQGQRQAALFELAALIGKTPAEVPATARQCRHAPSLATALPVGDGASLLRRRPDLRQAERGLAADTARIGVATADLYPRITLGASADYFRNGQLRGNRSWSFALGPLISWEFPHMAAARSRLRQARAQADASLAAFDAAVLRALKETEQALAAYNAALTQRAALLQARERAGKAFDLARQRYRAGAIAYLDVLVAQDEFIGARAQLAAADLRAGAERVAVFRALGGGWQTGADAAGLNPTRARTARTDPPIPSARP